MSETLAASSAVDAETSRRSPKYWVLKDSQLSCCETKRELDQFLGTCDASSVSRIIKGHDVPFKVQAIVALD